MYLVPRRLCRIATVFSKVLRRLRRASRGIGGEGTRSVGSVACIFGLRGLWASGAFRPQSTGQTPAASFLIQQQLRQLPKPTATSLYLESQLPVLMSCFNELWATSWHSDLLLLATWPSKHMSSQSSGLDGNTLAAPCRDGLAGVEAQKPHPCA